MIDVPMKTVDIIVNKKPVWCYTIWKVGDYI